VSTDDVSGVGRHRVGLRCGGVDRAPSRPFTTTGPATSAVNATVGVEATGYFVIAEALTNTADVRVPPAPDRGDEGTREGRTGA